MLIVSRALIVLMAVAFMSTGTTLAQNAPPPQQPMTSGMPHPTSTHPPSKCKTKPNGCPKRKKNKPPKAGTTGMPMPQPSGR